MKEINRAEIVYGMHFDDYLNVEALSNSLILKLKESALTCWQASWLNKDRCNESTTSMKKGSALHKVILEGEEAFNREYAVLPSKNDYGSHMNKGLHYKAWLKSHNLPISGTNSNLIRRIRENCPTAPLFDDVMDRFNADSKDKEIITLSDHQDIGRMVEAVECSKVAREAIEGGKPEVSIFWEKNGVKMKCRLDMLVKDNDGQCTIIDLKSFSSQSGRPIEDQLYSIISNRGYLMQAVIYREAVRVVTGCENPGYKIVFVQTGKVNGVYVRSLTVSALQAARWAESQYDGYVDQFNFLYKTFGSDPWRYDREVQELDDGKFPLYALGVT